MVVIDKQIDDQDRHSIHFMSIPVEVSEEFLTMASKRNISGKKPMFGHNRSKAMNATKRQFKTNMQTASIYVPELGRTLKVRVTAKELKTIDKIGLDAFLKRRGISINSLT